MEWYSQEERERQDFLITRYIRFKLRQGNGLFDSIQEAEKIFLKDQRPMNTTPTATFCEKSTSAATNE